MPRLLSRHAILCGFCALAAFTILGSMSVSAQEIPPTPDPTVVALEREKLAWEVAKLQEEAIRLRSQNEDPLAQWLKSDWLRNNAVVVSGAILGLIGIFRWLADRRQERRKRDEDRQAERETREAEWREDRDKRDVDRLTAVIDGLGSPDELARINAAHNLLSFLETGYDRFYTRILYLVVAHLRLQPKLETTLVDMGPLREPKLEVAPLLPFTQALVTIFKEAYPRVRALAHPSPVWQEKDSPSDPSRRVLVVRKGSPLDMSRIQLPGAYLMEADLSGVWMPNADLTGADLTGADLAGAILTQAHLVGTQFGGADLSGADLSGAALSLAYLSGANLSGTALSLADLHSADLTGAKLTGTDLRGAVGLTPEQRRVAAAQGAILDEPEPSA
jgi:hypothetical protein